jgi:NAD(P)-dependent dehydrogenase (short-subunit alcohol dehydrogenase family)
MRIEYRRRRADRALTVPFGRQGTGWEVVFAALFLISNESSYINAHTRSSAPALGRDRAELTCMG